MSVPRYWETIFLTNSEEFTVVGPHYLNLRIWFTFESELLQMHLALNHRCPALKTNSQCHETLLWAALFGADQCWNFQFSAVLIHKVSSTQNFNFSPTSKQLISAENYEFSKKNAARCWFALTLQHKLNKYVISENVILSLKGEEGINLLHVTPNLPVQRSQLFFGWFSKKKAENFSWSYIFLHIICLHVYIHGKFSMISYDIIFYSSMNNHVPKHLFMEENSWTIICRAENIRDIYFLIKISTTSMKSIYSRTGHRKNIGIFLLENNAEAIGCNINFVMTLSDIEQNFCRITLLMNIFSVCISPFNKFGVV